MLFQDRDLTLKLESDTRDREFLTFYKEISFNYSSKYLIKRKIQPIVIGASTYLQRFELLHCKF